MNNIVEKYEKYVIENINKENFDKTILFLYSNNCNFIEDIIEDYLDLLVIPYEDFVNKYNILNKKYNGEFLKLASDDMNLLEEFYYV